MLDAITKLFSPRPLTLPKAPTLNINETLESFLNHPLASPNDGALIEVPELGKVRVSEDYLPGRSARHLLEFLKPQIVSGLSVQYVGIDSSGLLVKAGRFEREGNDPFSVPTAFGEKDISTAAFKESASSILNQVMKGKVTDPSVS